MFNLMAKKYCIDEKQIEVGTKIETEHTSDKKEARRIAIEHLMESPEYYTYLKKMEKEMPKH